MIRNKDFAMLYARRAVFDKNGDFAGVVVGWNDMHGVIVGVEHVDGWQNWGLSTWYLKSAKVIGMLVLTI